MIRAKVDLPDPEETEQMSKLSGSYAKLFFTFFPSICSSFGIVLGASVEQ